MVLTYVCEESHGLIQLAESTHFPTLTIFGESVLGEKKNNNSGGSNNHYNNNHHHNNNNDDNNRALGPGDRERYIGRGLYFL